MEPGSTQRRVGCPTPASARPAPLRGPKKHACTLDQYRAPTKKHNNKKVERFTQHKTLFERCSIYLPPPTICHPPSDPFANE